MQWSTSFSSSWNFVEEPSNRKLDLTNLRFIAKLGHYEVGITFSVSWASKIIKPSQRDSTADYRSRSRGW